MGHGGERITEQVFQINCSFVTIDRRLTPLMILTHCEDMPMSEKPVEYYLGLP